MANYYADLLGYYSDGQGGWLDDQIKKAKGKVSNVVNTVKNVVNPPKPPAPKQLTGAQISNAFKQAGAKMPAVPVSNFVNTNQGTSFRPPSSTSSTSLSLAGARPSNAMPSYQSVGFSQPVSITGLDGLAPTPVVKPSSLGSSFTTMLNSLQGQLQDGSPLRTGLANAVAIPGDVLGIPRIGVANRIAGTSVDKKYGAAGATGIVRGGDLTGVIDVSGKSSNKGSQILNSSSQGLQSKGNSSTVAQNEKKRQELADLQAKGLVSDQVVDEYNKKLTDYSDDPSASSQANLDDTAWALVDENTNKYLDGMYGSEEEVESARAETERQNNEIIYNALKSSYQNQIPGLERDIDLQVNEQKQNVGNIEREGAIAKDERTNYFGDIVKRMVANSRASGTQLGNIFSGLGTVDSSSFQNKLGDIKRTELEGIGDTERDMAKSLTEIGNKVFDAKRQTESLIASIMNEGQMKKQAILDKINLTEEQKKVALSTINTELNTALNDAKRFYDTKKLELMENARNLASSRQLIATQGYEDRLTQNNLYENEAKLGGIVGGAIDPQAEVILQGLASQRISPSLSNPQVQQLLKLGMTYDQIIQYLNLYGQA